MKIAGYGVCVRPIILGFRWVSHEFVCVSCQECAVQSHLLECQHGTQLIFIVFMDIWKQAEENQVVQAIWEKNIGDIGQTVGPNIWEKNSRENILVIKYVISHLSSLGGKEIK